MTSSAEGAAPNTSAAAKQEEEAWQKQTQQKQQEKVAAEAEAARQKQTQQQKASAVTKGGGGCRTAFSSCMHAYACRLHSLVWYQVGVDLAIGLRPHARSSEQTRQRKCSMSTACQMRPAVSAVPMQFEGGPMRPAMGVCDS